MAISFFGGAFFGGEFFSSGSGSTPPPVVTTAPGHGRRWALKKDKQILYFQSVQQLHAFVDAQSQVVVPNETVKQAKRLGYKTIRLEAGKGNYDLLAKIEREIDAQLAAENMRIEKQDEDDFMSFIKWI